MPWHQRRELYLIILGTAIMALSIVVLVLNRDSSTEVLGAVGLIGGLAVILNILPNNGHPPES